MPVKNSQIANLLQEIAALLSLKGESRFRINAYEKAASAITSLGREVEDIYQEAGIEGLEAVDGVGKSIAEKIAEYLETGQITYHEKLRQAFPPVASQLLTIPGIGPQTALKIVGTLKIKKLSELPRALLSPVGRRNFGEKTRDKILSGLRFLKTQKPRLLISVAEPLAEEVISALMDSPCVTKADFVGSLRRRRETIGDIDFIAASTNPEATLEYITKQSFVRKILNIGGTKASIIHTSGIQMDFEILPKERYGSLLQHFTGSKAHNIHLRSYAESMGRSVSEYGVKNGKKIIACPNEECVYSALDMDLMPPELREDRGEIEAALNHTLPRLIQEKDIRGDLHVHSRWTDGRYSILDIAKAAQEIGYEYIAITDHTSGLGIAHGLDEYALRQRQKEIEAAQSQLPDTRILSGVEANIRTDGSIDLSDAVLSKLDVVIASIHWGFRESEQAITNRIVTAMKNPHVDIIGHPSGRLLNSREAMLIDWPVIFREAHATDTALEINAFPARLDLNDFLVQEAKQYNVKFSINTDAHLISQLNYMRYGLYVARRGWLEKKNVINTLALEALSWFLSHKKR